MIYCIQTKYVDDSFRALFSLISPQCRIVIVGEIIYYNLLEIWKKTIRSRSLTKIPRVSYYLLLKKKKTREVAFTKDHP